MNKWINELFKIWDDIEKGNDAADKYNPDSKGWKKESHIPYLGDYDPMHVLNLYYPKDYDGSRKLKTVIDIHGGGWLYGTVDLSERYLGWIASQGYAVMGMNYRLLRETDLGGLVQRKRQQNRSKCHNRIEQQNPQIESARFLHMPDIVHAVFDVHKQHHARNQQ